MIFKTDQYPDRCAKLLVTASLSMILLQNLVSESAHANSVWQVSNTSQYLFDSNYYKTNSNPVSEHTLRLKPSASIAIQQKRSVLNFSYRGTYGLNAKETNENQLSHTIHSGFDTQIGKASAFNFVGEYLISRDERGIPTSPVISTAPLANWSGKKIVSNITLPLVSKTKIRFGGGIEEKNYESAYAASSRNIIDASVTGILPVTFKTAFQMMYLHRSTSYHSSTLNSGKLDRLSAGVSWRTTGKTTSYANFGFETNNAIKTSTSYSGLFADIKFRWKRKSYSTVDFKISRQMTDTGYIADGYLVSNIVGINWKHKYTAKWSSIIGSIVSYDQYELGRNDINASPTIGITFTQSKELDYSLSFTTTQRKSSKSTLDYSSALIVAGFKIMVGDK